MKRVAELWLKFILGLIILVVVGIPAFIVVMANLTSWRVGLLLDGGLLFLGITFAALYITEQL